MLYWRITGVWSKSWSKYWANATKRAVILGSSFDKLFVIVVETNLADGRDPPNFALVLGNDISSSYALGNTLCNGEPDIPNFKNWLESSQIEGS